jgi:uncharacterized membrane protein YesL
MDILNSRVYHWLTVATDLLLLNVIWIICCLPIITIFPATAALFGTVRQWKIKQDTGVFKIYFKKFRENFKSSFLIGFLWIFVAFILYVDFQYIKTVGSTMQLVLLPLFLLLGLVFTFVTVYMFPVMVHYHTSVKNIIKNSFFLSVGNLFTTIFSLLVIALFGFTIVVVPILGSILCGILAYILYGICHRTFEKVARLQAELDKK